jgi:hypothetical protein
MGNQGKVWWSELNTWDVPAAMEFYGRTLGWTFEALGDRKSGREPYRIAKCDGQVVCGIFPLRSPDFDGMGSHWLTYLAVDDMTASLAETTAAGGTVLRPPFRVPGFGTIAIIRDATGAGLGLIEPEATSEAP